MTLCMAFTDGKTTWIGADTSHGNGRGWKWPLVAQKWRPCGPWMIGLAGSADIERAIAVVAQNPAVGDMAVQAICDAINAEYLAHGYKPEHRDNEKPYFGSSMMFARAGELWHVSSYLDARQVGSREWWCIGSADGIGFGVLTALERVGLPFLTYMEKMEIAVQTAHKYMPIIDGFWADVL